MLDRAAIIALIGRIRRAINIRHVAIFVAAIGFWAKHTRFRRGFGFDIPNPVHWFW
jgi:hypothetical protein